MIDGDIIEALGIWNIRSSDTPHYRETFQSVLADAALKAQMAVYGAGTSYTSRIYSPVVEEEITPDTDLLDLVSELAPADAWAVEISPKVISKWQRSHIPKYRLPDNYYELAQTRGITNIGPMNVQQAALVDSGRIDEEPVAIYPPRNMNELCAKIGEFTGLHIVVSDTDSPFKLHFNGYGRGQPTLLTPGCTLLGATGTVADKFLDFTFPQIYRMAIAAQFARGSDHRTPFTYFAAAPRTYIPRFPALRYNGWINVHMEYLAFTKLLEYQK